MIRATCAAHREKCPTNRCAGCGLLLEQAVSAPICLTSGEQADGEIVSAQNACHATGREHLRGRTPVG